MDDDIMKRFSPELLGELSRRSITTGLLRRPKPKPQKKE